MLQTIQKLSVTLFICHILFQFQLIDNFLAQYRLAVNRNIKK